MANVIKRLAQDPDFYDDWFESQSDYEITEFWNIIWDKSAQHHDNEFIQGLYDFYQKRGYLTHRQFSFLTRVVYPNLYQQQSLKDRLK